MGEGLRRQAGKHMMPLTRLIQACGFNQEALLDMLQNYIEDQCRQAFEQGKCSTVENVCMNLHSSPPQMVCGACEEAQRTVGSMLLVQSEIDHSREEKK